MLAREQGVQCGEGDVLVGANVSRDHRAVRCPDERAHEIHRRRGRRIAAGTHAGEKVVSRQHEARAVVRHVAVDRSNAKPLEAVGVDPVNVRSIDVAAQSVDLLPWCGDARSGSGRRAREADRAQVVRECFERIGLVKGNRGVLGWSFVAKTEIVIEELSPDPGPLGDAVFREDVLTHIVEDAVAHIAHRRTGRHAGDPVGVVRQRDPKVNGSRLAPGRMAQVVPASIECSDRKRICVARCRGGREGDDRKNECNDDRT